MSTPVAKRRRLDNSSKLTQPFKSPFKTPLKPSTKATSPLYPENLLNPSIEASSPRVNPETPTTTTLQPPAHSPLDPSLLSKDLPTLQSTQSSLIRQLATLRATLDQHEQALRIESSTRDADLHRLIGVWRVASRSAAEEVYSKARDRVNRMGGVGAMRDREKSGGWGRGWEEEDTGKKTGEGEQEDVDRDEEREERRREEEEREKEEEEEKVADDEPYTMAMMLKTLNIELPLIGYDAEMQRWID